MLAGRRLRLALVLVTLATCALGYEQKAPSLYHGWTGGYQYSHFCYTDVVALYYSEGLVDGKVPYFDHRVEYPVVIGGIMEVTARAAAVTPAPALQRDARFFKLNALLFAACAVVTVLAVAALSGSRPWHAFMLAASPMLLLTYTINWDLPAVMLTTLAMLAWQKRRAVTTGILLGLAVATKFYPVILLGPLLVLCVRERRLGAFARCLAGAAAAWIAVSAPVLLLAPHAFFTFYASNVSRTPDTGTVWFWVEKIGHVSMSALSLDLASGSLVLAGWFAIAALGLFARRRPRVSQLFFLALAVFLLTSKVWSMQYVLWLLPLAVLARPRWRDVLIWQAGELAYFFCSWLYALRGVQPGSGIGDVPLFFASAARSGTLIYLCVLVVRDVLRADPGLVRAERAPRLGFPAEEA